MTKKSDITLQTPVFIFLLLVMFAFIGYLVFGPGDTIQFFESETTTVERSLTAVEQELIGTYQDQKTDSSLRLMADGTAVFSQHLSDGQVSTQTGDWMLTDEGMVYVAAPVPVTFEVEENNLVLENMMLEVVTSDEY